MPLVHELYNPKGDIFRAVSVQQESQERWYSDFREDARSHNYYNYKAWLPAIIAAAAGSLGQYSGITIS